MIGLYMVGGYPNLVTFKNVYKYLQSLNIDFLEIGIPFNDPVADGPVIAEASYKVIGSGITYREIMDVICAEKIKPTYIMTYANIIYNAGMKNFSNSFKKYLDGVILADVPNRMHNFFYNEGFDIDIIPFATPLMRANDLAYMKNLRGNFIYFISTTGVTGSNIAGLDYLKEKVEMLKSTILDRKICVGFGIKTKRDYRDALVLFDGVIIGTEIVKRQHSLTLLDTYLQGEILSAT